MDGRLVAGDGDRMFDGAALDSRKVEPGQLFFALKGERTDGHRFVPEADRRGAAAAVVHRDVAYRSGVETASRSGGPRMGLIRVQDTFAGLHALTRHVRRQVPTEGLVAITGSAGKTSTKEMLAACLARRYRVARSPGNLNNLYGFPLSLLNVPDDTAWMVAEMGMSTAGELGRLARLGRPDVAVYTNVRPAHLESFGSLEAIAEAKAEMLEGLVAGGLVVANAADPQVVRIVERYRRERDPDARLVWYRVEGEGVGAEDGAAPGAPEPAWTLREAETATFGAGDGDAEEGFAGEVRSVPGGRPGYRFLLVGPAASVRVELPLQGRHNLENFLAAAATAGSLGVAPEELAATAATLEPASGRGQVHRLEGGVTVIDDSYNSNPAALGRALEGAAEVAARGGAQRRWAVLGDMLELGPESGELHRRGGREAAGLGFSPVVGVGELSRELVEAARQQGSEGRWFESTDEAADWAAGELADGDLVLVKGSRGIGLEAVVERLLEERPGRAERPGRGGG